MRPSERASRPTFMAVRGVNSLRRYGEYSVHSLFRCVLHSNLHCSKATYAMSTQVTPIPPRTCILRSLPYTTQPQSTTDIVVRIAQCATTVISLPPHSSFTAYRPRTLRMMTYACTHHSDSCFRIMQYCEGAETTTLHVVICMHNTIDRFA